MIGAGPAGVAAARRAAELGARTVLVTRDEFGGMAANDGPVPVRTLAHAARLVREARQLDRYGIVAGEPVLAYPRLLDRAREIVREVRSHSALREPLDRLGVTVHEGAGTARFVDAHTVDTIAGLRLRADAIIVCTGGVSRRLSVPGFEVTSTHSDAWNLTAVPASMLVIGAGDTGAQVASVFNAFGSRVELFEAAPHILPAEDGDVSSAVAEAFRRSGIAVHEDVGSIRSFEKTPDGVRMTFSKDNALDHAEAALAVVAVGWVADAVGMNLAAAGVKTDPRGFVQVDPYLRTSVSHIFAAGDITGHLMLVPQAVQEGFAAATNAVRDAGMTLGDRVSPVGSFTDPEYAKVGLTEAQARERHRVVAPVVHFDATTRAIIDGRTAGFCKLVVDRATGAILGCHVVGERAVEIAQAAAIAIAAGLRVQAVAEILFSFPTYAGILGRAAAAAARELNLSVGWEASNLEGPPTSPPRPD